MTVDEAKGKVVIGSRIVCGPNDIWDVISIQKRGIVIEYVGGTGHQLFIDWECFAAPGVLSIVG